MEIKETIGIDVSKLTLDAHIHSTGDRDRFENNTNGFKKLVAWAHKRSRFPKENVLFVFKHTGLYSRGLSGFFGERKLHCHRVAGLEIKRSLGIARGENDQVVARRIALYAYRLREEIRPSKVADVQIRKLRTMFSLRSKLIKQRAGYKTTLKEQKGILNGKDYNIIFEIQNNMLDTLSGEIHKLERMMMEIIKGDKGLSHLFKLVTSVKGVGPMTAMLVIIYTNRFTKFHTWRKFASYCGVAPFPHQSGTSIKGRSKVSHFANKELKAILNMCAASAIQYNPEMKQYYERRTEEGKNKMSTLNVIRNKLIARVFAVVNRGTPYINVYRQAS